MPTSPGYCGLTFENITIGCGQNCAATRAYCGHAHTEKLKTTASTAAAAIRRPFRTAMSFCQMTSSPAIDLEAVRLEPADELLAELAVDRLERRLQEVPAVAEVEDADADFAGLKMLEHDFRRRSTESVLFFCFENVSYSVRLPDVTNDSATPSAPLPYCALTHASLKCACLIDLRGRRFSASGVTDAAGAKKL